MPAQPHESNPESDWLARLDASIPQARRAADGQAPLAALHQLPSPHPASLPFDTLLAQCDLTRGRSGGPGGQHRNKVETLVHLTHTPTGLEAHAGERRSVAENKREALWRLRLILALFVRCVVPAGDARTDLWKLRCPASLKKPGRIAVSPTHDDYPALLAEALDNLWACDLDAGRAAVRLCCTPSQLVKLLKNHPPAMVLLNAHRSARNLHLLK